jgi:hypothetical protein
MTLHILHTKFCGRTINIDMICAPPRDDDGNNYRKRQYGL